MNKLDFKIDPANYGCSEARVVSICVEEGQPVDRGETLIEFECDKASFEVSMPADGTLEQICISVGDSICEETKVLVLRTKSLPADQSIVNDSQLTRLKERYPYVAESSSLKAAVEKLESAIRVCLSDPEDAFELARIYQESSTSYSAELPTAPPNESQVEWFGKAVKSKSKTFWKCELVNDSCETEIIGHCNVEQVSRTPRENCNFIGLYVAGPNLPWTCGKLLAQHVLAACKENKLTHHYAITRPMNGPAIKLLRSLGFEETKAEADMDSKPIFFHLWNEYEA